MNRLTYFTSMALIGLISTACVDAGDPDGKPEGGEPGDGQGPNADGGSGGDGGSGDGGGSGEGGGSGGSGGSGATDGGDVGPDPDSADDGDGLTLEEEEDYGTDPDDADSDGDGWEDGEEIDAGTNPNYAYSRPYQGGYNVGWCDEEPNATGPTGSNGHTSAYQRNDIVDNFTLTDQYGEAVDLYSFCGQHVMLVFSAGWCGPCQSLAMEVQDIQDRYEADGFQAIEILIEDSGGNAPNLEDLRGWEALGDMENIPVLGDGDYQVWPYYEADWGIPSTTHIAPDGTILSMDQYVTDPGSWL